MTIATNQSQGVPLYVYEVVLCVNSCVHHSDLITFGFSLDYTTKLHIFEAKREKLNLENDEQKVSKFWQHA